MSRHPCRRKGRAARALPTSIETAAVRSIARGSVLVPNSDEFRHQIARVMEWEDAHVSFDSATEDIPDALRGKAPPGLPHSPWQIVEHIRRAQADILAFCRNEPYTEREWPADYWPAEEAPPSNDAWEESVDAVRRDRDALKQIALDTALPLTARVPHGTSQTYLRELLLAADHTAYHVGTLIVTRRLLGAWPDGRTIQG